MFGGAASCDPHARNPGRGAIQGLSGPETGWRDVDELRSRRSLPGATRGALVVARVRGPPVHTDDGPVGDTAFGGGCRRPRVRFTGVLLVAGREGGRRLSLGSKLRAVASGCGTLEL